MHLVSGLTVIYSKIKARIMLKYDLFYTSRSFECFTIKSLNEGILCTYRLVIGFILKGNTRNVETTVNIAGMMSL